MSAPDGTFSASVRAIRHLYDRIDRRFAPIVPLVVYIVAFLFIPMSYIFYASFHEFEPFEAIGEGYTLEQYTDILFTPFYQDIIIFTVKLAVITTIGCFVLGYILGYFIARTTPRMRSIMLFSIFLPIMVGSIVRVYGWITILGRQGLLNDILAATTGSRTQLLGSRWAVYVGLISVLLPFVVLPVYSSVEDIPESLELAARNLGANRFQAFYRVVFPLSLPGAVTGSIFVFAISMSAVVVPILLGGRGNNTLGSIMYDVALGDFNWPQAGAIAIILSFVTLLIIFTYLKLVRDKLAVEQPEAYQ